MFRDFTTRQKVALLIPLLIAGVTFGLLWVSGPGTTAPPDDAVVEALIPEADTKVLQQTDVGIDLVNGWDAELFVNGVPIPPDQLDKAPGLGRVTFRPGPEREVEVLGAGQNCATAIYWSLADPTQRFTKTWCFSIL